MAPGAMLLIVIREDQVQRLDYASACAFRLAATVVENRHGHVLMHGTNVDDASFPARFAQAANKACVRKNRPSGSHSSQIIFVLGVSRNQSVFPGPHCLQNIDDHIPSMPRRPAAYIISLLISACTPLPLLPAFSIARRVSSAPSACPA